ncbi:translationally-controlled tumor protein [Streptomyces sp. NPDC017520]|uniref:translationally-controlled tumor protein n=1 Tax=Streptomyces sp. NPDC017520 TaxID=3364998 RepID=UPI0037BBFF00
MLLYSDIITGDHIVSDGFPMQLVDDVVFQVGCMSDEDEDGDGAVDSFVHHFRLQPVTFDKSGYQSQLSGYMKAVKLYLTASGAGAHEVTAFEKGASAYAKKISANFGSYEFYTGASRSPDGMVGLLSHHSDGVTPYFTFWKHGLRAEQV